MLSNTNKAQKKYALIVIVFEIKTNAQKVIKKNKIYT